MKKDDVLALAVEKECFANGHLSRRYFLSLSAVGLAGAALCSRLAGQEKIAGQKPQQDQPPDIKTNLDEIKKFPRTKNSLPGLFPGEVVKIPMGTTSNNGKIDTANVRKAVNMGIIALTGEKAIKAAWLKFVKPDEIIGIKVNPIGGKLLSTKPEVVDVIIEGLLEAGVPKKNIVIWDRRHFQLEEAGFIPERFPGIEITGTEMKGPNGDFYDDKGELWSKDNIDRDAPFYTADIELKYDKDIMPYMVNMGKESYFTKIVTRKVDKIINVPILKNRGATVTCCLKNLSYGSLSNTSRLHKIPDQSVSEPVAFPVLRDKVVLNIVDGLQACYDGGPGANPKFIYDANVMMFGTDPVAVDRIGHEFIIKERMARGVQQLEDKKRTAFLDIAADLGLGVSQRDKIKVKELALA